MTQDSGYFVVRHGRAYRQAQYRPKRRSYDSFEVGALIALAIGGTLMVAIWMRWL